MFRTVLSPIILVVCFQVAHAEDALVQGGKSPNGRYEVRLCKSGEISPGTSGYSYELADSNTGKVLQQFSAGGGFADYYGAIMVSEVLWSPSSRYFALLDHGSRHSMELYLFRVAGSGVIELKAPDYLKKGLTLAGEKTIYLVSVVKPISWSENSLTSNFYFDATTVPYGRSPLYSTKFKIAMPKGDGVNVELVSMDKPVGNPND